MTRPKREGLRRVEEAVRSSGGVQLRLLQCDTCSAVWPTERDEKHGGARLDGEPCAYRWPGGRVCNGRVHPLGHEHREHREDWARAHGFAPRMQPLYATRWRAILGLPGGTTDVAAVKRAYRTLAKERHPDAGGSNEAMVELNEAYRQALSELGQP